MNPEPPYVINGAWMPTVVFAPETEVSCEAAFETFRAADIDARVFFHPLSSLDMFEARPENVRAYDIAARAINLPSYHDITDDQLGRVCAVVKQLCSTGGGRRSKSASS
jgi:perosamine synthetase